MRKPIVAGNWKMNRTSDEAETLARGVVDAVLGADGVDVVVCPPHTALERVSGAVKGSSVGLGAQNMHWEAEGAYTGEVSGAMLLTCGCEYVILGHSERRQYFGETDQTVNKRLKTALDVGLKPIVCVGETLEERKSEVTDQVVRKQVTGGLEGILANEAQTLVLAYEPVWAIGTGLTATPDQADAVHGMIRQVLVDLYDETVAQSVRIQYGGSMKPDNAADLLGQPNIDGGLIGGAALDADSFAAIVKAAI
ncbi:MAG: triose-phosphate isomerase [Candidatus Latescibacteria bacterium]|jgi:triosephosphate isomerase (TIM)|nr:triose-phosphate isomerase [Candidatus Latescibacterota bacterium]MBT5830948.1 triose-phosphate isomerase [Candidatus Latescibacterota bacterium]